MIWSPPPFLVLFGRNGLANSRSLADCGAGAAAGLAGLAFFARCVVADAGASGAFSASVAGAGAAEVALSPAVAGAFGAASVFGSDSSRVICCWLTFLAFGAG